MRLDSRAERWLEGLIDLERCAGARARAALARRRSARCSRASASPERGLRPIHVAGSKGKGSTALLCRGAAARRRLRDAAPSRRRISSAGPSASASTGARSTATRSPRRRARCGPHVEALRAEARSAPTFFDATTAAALLLFAEARVDAALARGRARRAARLDERRRARRRCVTSIELEHTEISSATRSPRSRARRRAS